jgi:4-hydroxybenzoate polyprenyltransferase
MGGPGVREIFLSYVKLIRPAQWVKNLFILLPVFFSGELFNTKTWPDLVGGFICFSLVASSVYILNDLRDLNSDRLHPTKKLRPLASGDVSRGGSLILGAVFVCTGLLGSYLLRDKFGFVLLIYFVLNVLYSLGLKRVSILDVFLVSIGFNLRVKAGATLAYVGLSEWLTIMVFLLALFMSVAKRRDDVLIRANSGIEMRKSLRGYNMDFINAALSVVGGVIVVAYFMYTTSDEVQSRLGTHRLYYTCIFVLGGLLRYLQLVYIENETGSPTKILYRDRFIQVCIFMWIASFYFILYARDKTFFG